MLQKNEKHSGDHLTHGDGDRWAVQSDIPERQAVTGHNVRYVLFWGVAGAIVALAIVYAMYFH